MPWGIQAPELSETKLKVAIRADASVHMGIGHFMRCLTLADALKQRGAHTRFISRHLPSHLHNILISKGHEFALLNSDCDDAVLDELAHANWLGVSQIQDATDSIRVLSDETWDWLIVDHYSLDTRWEKMLARCYKKLMVIDDLADRAHFCDLLLDQTFGRSQADYLDRVPVGCLVLCGSQYALLRPEFAAIRETSLARRVDKSALDHLLITMGGTDHKNATGNVLESLKSGNCLPPNCKISVVMGPSAPQLKNVIHLSNTMPWSTNVYVDLREMAQLMADSDLAIGAAGATSWERCCLGLPTVLLTLAVNQEVITSKLQEVGAVVSVEFQATDFGRQLCSAVSRAANKTILQNLSMSAAAICDGGGTARVMEVMSGR